MQNDMFRPDEDLEAKWEVLEVKYKPFTWNAQNKMWDKFPIYVHTRPKNWRAPETCFCDIPPWEPCCETCPAKLSGNDY